VSKLFDAGGHALPDVIAETAVATRPASLLDIIAQVVMDPRVDVEKMERLLAMQQQIIADERQIAFKAALTELQGEIPQIEKDGRVIVKNVERSRYAKYETIDEYVRPLMAKHGFSISFDEVETTAATRKFSATLSHRAGHAETKYKVMPYDHSEYRSASQSEGSTVSYARRALLKMHLNLVEKDEDDDGGGGSKPITSEQEATIQALIEEVKANKARLLDYLHVSRLEDILARDYASVIAQLQRKRQKVDRENP
jgi:hypothetical protein